MGMFAGSVALTSILFSFPVTAANWPAWRGPEGSGIANERNLPLQWSTNKSVRWRVPLPDRGNSTPIVWRRRVFVTQAITKESQRTVMCFDRKDGKLLWQSGITWTEKERTHDENPPCTPSPVTDGKRIIAWFGSAGVYCYDFDGRELWHRDLGPQSHQWGYASSPVLYRDLCLINFGPGDRSFVIALEKSTGRTVWKFDVPSIGPETKWEDVGGQKEYGDRPGAPKVSELAGSWATPLVVRANKRDELIVPLPLRLVAFEPKTGAKLWNCAGPNTGAYNSAFLGDELVGFTCNGFINTELVVRPGGRGDVTATHRLWHQVVANSKGCVGSGVIYRGHIYLMNYSGFAECLDLKTGKTVWYERMTGTGARNESWSSPVLAEDRLYVPNRDGDVFVLRASPKFERLALNSIGGEPMNASLAVSDGNIFIRTYKNLWCIGKTRK